MSLRRCLRTRAVRSVTNGPEVDATQYEAFRLPPYNVDYCVLPVCKQSTDTIGLQSAFLKRSGRVATIRIGWKRSILPKQVITDSDDAEGGKLASSFPIDICLSQHTNTSTKALLRVLIQINSPSGKRPSAAPMAICTKVLRRRGSNKRPEQVDADLWSDFSR